MVAVLRKIQGGLRVIERIVSRDLDAPAKFAPTLKVRKGNARTEEASNDGRVRVRIIHVLNISHKELTYLLQKSTSHQKPRHYAHAPWGIDW